MRNGGRSTASRLNTYRAVAALFGAWLAALLAAALAAGPISAAVNWDQPFRSPQYINHATGHGTTSGGVKDDFWFLFPDKPTNGFMLLPDGSGGTFTYSIDQFSGPFST